MRTKPGKAKAYQDRRDAGHVLASYLQDYAGKPDALVLGLPRGGVPVAAVVAGVLELPMDVVLVRKIGVPGHVEVAMGAMASVAGHQVTVRNEEVLARYLMDFGHRAAFDDVAERERAELDRREQLYRAGRGTLHVSGQTVIVVDDGLATGATMRAAVTVLRELEPARIIAAAPVGLGNTCDSLRRVADDVVCPWNPKDFVAVGQAYEIFDQTSDEEVIRLLAGQQP
ncbi:phosphoribosyltransferase [Arthrobacter crystallopoietes BAB-32]|uniref:Phosphoribosyltransferase n=1 Tax=Arthrobacter crystallopoietes BAB-32 TaxID=1246476 RepID=N1UVS3_9MICC|nr:phosphoribosyltransferase family protein [Arthrobacter crystallopoietes]EMY34506.1 phosphoribosyltransferase [Arthrobacter crystallopoietes BAB-32]